MPVLLAASMGVFQLVIPFILYAKALQVFRAVETIILKSAEPILNPLWVGETPGWNTIAGGVIVFGALVVHSLLKERNAGEADP